MNEYFDITALTNEELLKEYFDLVDTSVMWDSDPDKEVEENWAEMVNDELTKRNIPDSEWEAYVDKTLHLC